MRKRGSSKLLRFQRSKAQKLVADFLGLSPELKAKLQKILKP